MEALRLTFRKTARGYLVESSSKKGAIRLQGPHQLAVKSTTTSLVAAAASSAEKPGSSATTFTALITGPGCSVIHILTYWSGTKEIVTKGGKL